MLPWRYRMLKTLDGSIGRRLCHRWPAPRSAARAGPAAWQAPPVAPEGIARILVVRPGGLGDATLTFPMLQALRAHYRDASLHVLAERRNAAVYRINGLVEEVHCYDRRPLSTLRELAQRRYDIVIDTEQYHHFSTLVCRGLKPRYLCGFDTLGRGRLQSHRVRYSEQEYEVYLFLALAEALIGTPLGFDPEQPFLEVDKRWQEQAQAALAASRGRDVVAIVPSATTEHRVWPVERYLEVLRWLVAGGLYPVLLGGADAVVAGRRIAAGFAGDEVLDLTGRSSLEQTAGIVAQARLYISTDTGVLHLAYGVGTPTVHMFGSGIQQKWAPPGSRYQVINKQLPCSPCTRYGATPPCPYDVECMSAIAVEDVIRAAGDVLRR